jgi:hypothetical protein
MEEIVKKTTLFALMFVLCMVSYSVTAHAEWNFGLGTGPFLLNVKGDQGFHTDIVGPITWDVDLDNEDMKDLMDSAIGLGGYATDGQWMIKYSFAMLKLEDDPSMSLTGGGFASAELEFDITAGELTVGYPVVSNESYVLRPYVGVRYIKHELSTDLTVTVGSDTTRLSQDVDENWTDVLVGASLDVPFAQKFNWNVTADAGFGGSEGTYLGSTGITWLFAKHWSTTLYGKYLAVEFENGSKGDADWYLYDVDEFGTGLNLMYNW